MKVQVIAEQCQGHNRCALSAPELFEIDDLGYASAKGDGVVPPGLEAKARLAAANCPEQAVVVEE
ncbi:ferredoxin [Acidiferrimicrobium sp. IK]|uniref:ferredoxin n=1 Tax=Acidiferrimicrobium sp. IK TaxID=2871700 RepID=UPI0021CB19F4|nr:ferredoxin [Acidiferrimicrobium sp. IK]MCU4187470.1 ferredoxin [Acidiferrimicrobium sp. IK]